MIGSRTLRNLKRAAIDLGARPYRFALVTGCPRSGTTAVIEWLGTHPGLSVVSESRILIAAHRFLQATDRWPSLFHRRPRLIRHLRVVVSQYYFARLPVWNRLVIEKEPLETVALPDLSYRSFVENVQALFPDGKLLFMIRHPVPTVWSMRQRTWGSEELPLDTCIQVWRDNARLIVDYRGRPNVLVCRFEDLVSATAPAAPAILQFLGVERGVPFVPRATDRSAFDPKQERRILEETGPERTALGY